MKKIILFYLMFASVASAFAQGNGMQGITEATSIIWLYGELLLTRASTP